jgi:hypothetical protein
MDKYIGDVDPQKESSGVNYGQKAPILVFTDISNYHREHFCTADPGVRMGFSDFSELEASS